MPGGGYYDVTNPEVCFAFSGNSADVSGGAINNYGTLTVTNSTFSQNTATSYAGGGIVDSGSATVSNSTFSQNSAPEGGGIYINSGNTQLHITILASSTSGGNCRTNIAQGGTISDGGYNIEDANTCRFSAANNSVPNTNPLLVPAGLQDNGGPTKTIALQSTSPALDRIPQDTNGCGTTMTERGGAGKDKLYGGSGTHITRQD